VVISPGGTLTAKRLELLRELVPAIKKIGFVVTEEGAAMDLQTGEARKAAHRLGLDMPVVTVARFDCAAAFSQLASLRVGAARMAASPFFLRDRKTIIDLARKHRLPAMLHNAVRAGGLWRPGLLRARLRRTDASGRSPACQGAQGCAA